MRVLWALLIAGFSIVGQPRPAFSEAPAGQVAPESGDEPPAVRETPASGEALGPVAAGLAPLAPIAIPASRALRRARAAASAPSVPRALCRARAPPPMPLT